MKVFSRHVRKWRYTREDATCSSIMPHNLRSYARKILFSEYFCISSSRRVASRSKVRNEHVSRNHGDSKYYRASRKFQLFNLGPSLVSLSLSLSLSLSHTHTLFIPRELIQHQTRTSFLLVFRNATRSAGEF